MRRILAVLAVLCLGVMMVPNTGGDNLLLPLNNDIAEDCMIKGMNDESSNDTNFNTDSLAVGNSTSSAWRAVIWLEDNHLANNTDFSIVYLEMYCASVLGTATEINISIHELYDNFNETEVTWNNRTDYDAWRNAAGHYNSTPIDTVKISAATAWYKWDITTVYREWANNGSQNLGLILVDYGDNPDTFSATFRSSEHATTAQRPILNLTYTGGDNNPTGTSNITEDVWNLKGFSGETKNASTIYSEITDCSALSYKNATSGYYYTYWPLYGMLENEDIEFGDGLFILTSSNSTWDHN